ncbi:MAG: hypothetical protein KatS3mg109_2376 [Pirellulaceae bacterium]|nr:MAG: hypothetical protein KatS3mg109_2376 [Pirellulaceae bacterium]
MIWISGIALVGLAVALLLAPAFEVKLTKRVVNPIVVAALLLAVAFMLANAATYVTDREVLVPLGMGSGIVGALGLFFVVVGCGRFAMSDQNSEQRRL